jgi:hypothetical protein
MSVLMACFAFDMTKEQRDRDISFWERRIKNMRQDGDKRGFLTSNERQEIAWCETKIEETREAYRRESLVGQTLKDILIRHGA